MKIYDCFSYWDEDLLLDLRLNILNDSQAFISGDGFAVDESLEPGDYILINRSEYKAIFVRFGSKQTFYSTLTSRLGILDRS